MCRGEHGNSTEAAVACRQKAIAQGEKEGCRANEPVYRVRVATTVPRPPRVPAPRPIGLMQQVRDECGNVGTSQRGGKRGHCCCRLLSSEFFFRRARRRVWTGRRHTIRGADLRRGVVYDASPERKNAAQCRGGAMRKGHSTHRRSNPTDDGPTGVSRRIDLLNCRADHLHPSSARDRQGVSRPARRAFAKSITKLGGTARSPYLPIETSVAATKPCVWWH